MEERISKMLNAVKRNCKCARGETHPSYYFFTGKGGKLKKIYMPKSKLKETIKIADEAKAERIENRKDYIPTRRLIVLLRALEKEKWQLIQQTGWRVNKIDYV